MDNEIKNDNIIPEVDGRQIAQKSANERLLYLRQMHKSITQKKSSVDLLIARYNVEQSFFDKASSWYGSLSWWIKALGAVLATIFSIGAAALSPVALAVMVFCSIVGVISHFVLSGHNRINTARIERMKTDIVELERDLTGLVDDLSAIEDNFKEVLISLVEKEVQLEEQCASYQKSHDALEAEIIKLKISGELIEEGKTKLHTEVTDITKKLSDTTETLGQGQELVTEKISTFKETEQELSGIKASLEQSGGDLKRIEADYQARIEQLTALNEMLSETLDPIFAMKEKQEKEGLVSSAVPIEHSLGYHQKILDESKRCSIETQADIAATREFLLSIGVVIDEKPQNEGSAHMLH